MSLEQKLPVDQLGEQNCWMHALAKHWQRMREKYPEEKLAVVFDIDGTIIDTRHTQLYLLQAFDLEYSHRYGGLLFEHVSLHDITCYENFMAKQLEKWGYEPEVVASFIEFYHRNRWSENVLVASETAYPRVINLIEILDRQHETIVALNTGRCESMRTSTLKSLAQMSPGTFREEWLKMNPNGWTQVHLSKQMAIEEIERQGAKVIAMIDNEPSNLNRLAHLEHEVLLLHADTIYGNPEPLHDRCLSGSEYKIASINEWNSIVAA